MTPAPAARARNTSTAAEGRSKGGNGCRAMKNAAVAKVFQDIADLLELKEENAFKIRAYQKAARTIENLPLEVEQLMEQGKLRQVPGIGEAIEKKMSELFSSDTRRPTSKNKTKQAQRSQLLETREPYKPMETRDA